jgi:hypothetical protein
MEHLTPPSVGASFKKWSVVHPFKSHGLFPKLPKKKKKKKKEQFGPIKVSTWGRPWLDDPWSVTSSWDVVARPRPLVASNLATRGRWPQIVGPGPISDQRSLAGCGSLDKARLPFFLNFFFSSPPFFGQLLLVGSSTCPSCLDFS